MHRPRTPHPQNRSYKPRPRPARGPTYACPNVTRVTQVSANTDADLYGRDLVRAVIDVKWDSFARAFLLMQVGGYVWRVEGRAVVAIGEVGCVGGCGSGVGLLACTSLLMQVAKVAGAGVVPSHESVGGVWG